ncbi:uncharacterized protein L969DRAFT_103421 [Mixia osmundae IAM 14324]|uniref:Nucleolar protein 58 n=1 Tax=Mixia osmundae (strain CBS 9802 / IAM 14324 / JCM 22182 / KY 12970) TaxID=764103 RepID=G7E0W9_MIXOS|nr:uncharacterized protein L969DRAFT_103421 [Mixia osmundae IAM 14324]KEI39508.1 hypothetical protein L969DRAFT_103421 [Mixia osmundae IAM 14324]GAA96479.1 hypothetical protein E5Q_03147 [Mixia osmundae IAM 14324]
MLVLYETSLGFCLFRLADNGKLEDKNLWKEFETPEGANNLLKLQSIHRFSSTADAVEDITAISAGKLSKSLKKFLVEEVQDKHVGKKGSATAKETLLVSDPKLGGAISKKLEIQVISESTKLQTQDLYRGMRTQIAALLGEYQVEESDLNTMALGLSHSLSRYKLKFSPDKVDTMIVQAIALLDDLDKEINIYSMRVKEWYGWHFPEMAKIISDNLAYAKVVKAMGLRTNAASTDFSTILPEQEEETLKAAAVISMGTEISDSDLAHIHLLTDQVISITTYRAELYSYLQNRMAAIAPNLTALLGELVGARLIAHAGTLLNLAKQPASTVQILGAEKALFRAMKTKHDTPKYGLIFHASLVGQAPQKLKGKMARMVATKAALSIRLDALADADTRSGEEAPSIGLAARAKLESRLRFLQEGMGIQSVRRADRSDRGNQAPFEMRGTGATYNSAADSLIPTQRQPVSPEVSMTGDEDEKAAKKRRKEEKRAAKAAKAGTSTATLTNGINGDASHSADLADETTDKAARKEAKRLKKAAKAAAAAANTDALPAAAVPDPSTSSKKRKAEEAETTGGSQLVGAEVNGEKKKKKKRHSEA